MKYNEAAVAPNPSMITAPLITGIMGLAMGLLLSPVGPFLRRSLLPAAGSGLHSPFPTSSSHTTVYSYTAGSLPRSIFQLGSHHVPPPPPPLSRGGMNADLHSVVAAAVLWLTSSASFPGSRD